jgi:hypothetical protein
MEDLKPGTYQVLAFAPPGSQMLTEVHLILAAGDDCYALCLKTPDALDELVRRLKVLREVVFGNAETERH